MEAEAINSAFTSDQAGTIFVGSIKTVMGHTEGIAGLAGLIKTSLALQNATIPPNLLFNRINPRIEPFSANLHVLTPAIPWPTSSSIRRASVNK